MWNTNIPDGGGVVGEGVVGEGVVGEGVVGGGLVVGGGRHLSPASSLWLQNVASIWTLVGQSNSVASFPMH